uniref:Uncharacterized protein n=1 Tax=Azospirillum himalayense TaxID=654847 RepID=A0ABW0FXM6_9PROT
MTTFIHPMNAGYTETVGVGSVILTALLGPLYLVYVRAWFAALLTLVIGGPLLAFLTMATASGGNVAAVILCYVIGSASWGLAMVPLIEKSYLRRGWKLA